MPWEAVSFSSEFCIVGLCWPSEQVGARAFAALTLNGIASWEPLLTYNTKTDPGFGHPAALPRIQLAGWTKYNFPTWEMPPHGAPFTLVG